MSDSQHRTEGPQPMNQVIAAIAGDQTGYTFGRRVPVEVGEASDR